MLFSRDGTGLRFNELKTVSTRSKAVFVWFVFFVVEKIGFRGSCG